MTADYIIEALTTFLKVFKKKRPEMSRGEWFFHWDNAPVHKALKVRDFLVTKDIKMIEHPPYSPDLAPADYFLFPKVKSALAGMYLTQETFKKEWEWAVRTIKKEEFTTAFQRWLERCSKCIDVEGHYVEK